LQVVLSIRLSVDRLLTQGECHAQDLVWTGFHRVNDPYASTGPG
jgi:hypothetical protein